MSKSEPTTLMQAAWDKAEELMEKLGKERAKTKRLRARVRELEQAKEAADGEGTG